METTTVRIDVSELATGVILCRKNQDSSSPLVEGDGNKNEPESRSSICRALFPSNERLMSEVQEPVYQEGISHYDVKRRATIVCIKFIDDHTDYQ
jgi:hypothetical protein